MSRRALSAGVVAGIAIVAVLVLWTTREQGREVVDRTEAHEERPADSDSPAPAGSPPVAPSAQRDWFPDLSSPGETLDADAGGVRASFNCDMDRLQDPYTLLSSVDSDEGKQSLNQLVSTLSASGDAEMLMAASGLEHFAAMVEGETLGPAALVPNMERALAADPMNPAVLWSAAQLCGAEPEVEICKQSWLRANFDTALGGNGEYWAREAVYRYRADDEPGALAAIRRAASSPEFDNFVVENMRILERAFSAAPNIDYRERAITAYAMASGFFPSRNPGLLRLCGTNAETDPEWWDACLDLASRYLADGRTLSSREMGARLQGRLYSISGDDELREAASETHSWLDDADLASADDDVVSVMLTDERVLRGFLDEFESSDELSALEWLTDEVARLKQDPEYDPCPDHESAN